MSIKIGNDITMVINVDTNLMTDVKLVICELIPIDLDKFKLNQFHHFTEYTSCNCGIPTYNVLPSNPGLHHAPGHDDKHHRKLLIDNSKKYISIDVDLNSLVLDYLQEDNVNISVADDTIIVVRDTGNCSSAYVSDEELIFENSDSITSTNQITIDSDCIYTYEINSSINTDGTISCTFPGDLQNSQEVYRLVVNLFNSRGLDKIIDCGEIFELTDNSSEDDSSIIDDDVEIEVYTDNAFVINNHIDKFKHGHCPHKHEINHEYPKQDKNIWNRVQPWLDWWLFADLCK